MGGGDDDDFNRIKTIVRELIEKKEKNIKLYYINKTLGESVEIKNFNFGDDHLEFNLYLNTTEKPHEQLKKKTALSDYDDIVNFDRDNKKSFLLKYNLNTDFYYPWDCDPHTCPSHAIFKPTHYSRFHLGILHQKPKRLAKEFFQNLKVSLES